MNPGLSDRTQQVGIGGLLLGIIVLLLGVDGRIVLAALLVAVLASSRYAWSQIRTRGGGRPQELLQATLVPVVVCFVAMVIVVWKFTALTRG